MKQNDTIDYSALDNYRFLRLLPLAVRQTFRSRRYKVLNIALTVIAAPSIIVSLIDPREAQKSVLNIFVYYLIFFAFWTIYYFYRFRRDQLQAFAAANGWGLRPYKNGEPLPSVLSTSAYANDVSTVIEMVIEDIAWDVFCMNWPRNQLHKFTVFRTKLDKNIPHMILDSTRTKGLLAIPKGWMRVELEGHFYKNFILHIRPKTQIGVLSYMAPDLMYVLDQNHRLHDLQIENQYLFVITDGDVRDGDNMKQVLPSLSRLYHKIN